MAVNGDTLKWALEKGGYLPKRPDINASLADAWQRMTADAIELLRRQDAELVHLRKRLQEETDRALWPEFYRGLDKIEGKGTPPCTGCPKAVEHDARNYPL